MSKPDQFDRDVDQRGRRYELYLETGDAGLEHMTLARMVDLASAPRDDVPRTHLAALACRIYDTRRERARFFNNSMLGEPVWDMMLALYCLPSRNDSLSVTGLCYACAVAPTTGQRWLQLMHQKGLIQRKPDPEDGRRICVSLSDLGDELMSKYLTSIYYKLVP